MTWHAERVQGRPEGEAREKLLAKRAAHEEQILALAKSPLRSQTNAAIKGRQEDLLVIVKKIKAIDKKLGREVT